MADAAYQMKHRVGGPVKRSKAPDEWTIRRGRGFIAAQLQGGLLAPHKTIPPWIKRAYRRTGAQMAAAESGCGMRGKARRRGARNDHGQKADHHQEIREPTAL
jgi:hypothetical protein